MCQLVGCTLNPPDPARSCILAMLRDESQMTRKFHTMSIEDREMFAYNANYNKQKAEIARINAHPEQRMKYAFEFLVGADDGMRVKCYDAIAKYSAQLDYSEAHF